MHRCFRMHMFPHIRGSFFTDGPVTKRSPSAATESRQVCALGAAIFESVASRLHPDVESARAKMSSGLRQVFRPSPESSVYEGLHRKHLSLGETERRVEEG